MATYAVGDLQGCLNELKTLLDQVGFGSDDRLWLTGDLVNRGPDSLATLRFVKNLGEQAISVLGNHDLHLLAIVFNQSKPNHKDTLDEILAADDRDELLFWLRHLPLLHHDQKLGYSMVHAGIPPVWDLSTAASCAREVEAVLQGPQASQFFRHMYGNEPSQWHPQLEGWPRYRLITNYLTRIRFCNASGQLELLNKSGPGTAPLGYAPWYSFVDRLSANDRILFGHWASLEGLTDAANVYALDTGCVWGGQLTAMRLEDQRYFSTLSSGYA